MKTRMVVIQPTSFCNLNCRYCYLPFRTVTKRISVETLSQVFETLFSSSLLSDELLFVWHAGEPLVLPIGFYERAFDLQQKWNSHGVHISNSLQTNATLITQQWCRFFKEYEVHVGVSLDGSQLVHDANRVDRLGRGTFERVLRGIELLKNNDIPYSVIAVITKEAVADPDNFWQFFSHLHPDRLGLNPEEIEGVNKDTSLRAESDIDSYKQFFQRIVSLNESSRHPLAIREIEHMKRHIQFTSMQMQALTNAAQAILSFDCDGNVSTFSPELLTATHHAYGNFIFGNVFESSLEEMFARPKFIEVNQEIQRGVNRCRETCEYFAFCGGGSPSNKLHENGTFDCTETIACRLKVKVTTDVLLDYLEAKYYLEASRDREGFEGSTRPAI